MLSKTGYRLGELSEGFCGAHRLNHPKNYTQQWSEGHSGVPQARGLKTTAVLMISAPTPEAASHLPARGQLGGSLALETACSERELCRPRAGNSRLCPPAGPYPFAASNLCLLASMIPKGNKNKRLRTLREKFCGTLQRRGLQKAAFVLRAPHISPLTPRSISAELNVLPAT